MSKYEVLKNHLITIHESKGWGILDFDEEVIKVLNMCKDFKDEQIKEL